MSKTITSGVITFMDTTDDRKLDIYISSNHPTVQILNQNTGLYTPNWSTTNLQLSAEIYLDSKDVTTDSQTDIGWYTKIGTIETLIGTGTEITVSTNDLATNPIITYICKAEYQNIDALSQITFTRVDTGKNGTDGTSVNIKGTATSVTPVSNTDYYTITYDETSLSTAELGDAYIYNGDLYVCTDSRDGVDYFINIGRIQGPAGENAKNIVLSGSAQVFKISKTNVYTPATISVTAHTFNTSATTWTYSEDGGKTWQTTAPTGAVRNGNIVTVTGSTLVSNSIVIKASDGTVEDVFTIYKAFDGADGSDGEKGDPAPLAFLTNENISFAADSNGKTYGTSMTTNVVAYVGDQKVLPTIGTILTAGLPDGISIAVDEEATELADNEIVLMITVANGKDLGSILSISNDIAIPIVSPVSTSLKLTWSKINTGATGISVNSTQVKYGISKSSTEQPTEWFDDLPTVADGAYLWTRTITDYTDSSLDDTVVYTYAKQGEKGDSGVAGSSVTVSSIQYQEGASATTAPTGEWSNAVVAVAEGKYLWTKTAFSDESVAYGVAKQGVSGSDAYTVLLTNESNTFAGSVLNALAGETTTQVLAYKGATAQTVTINSVNGVAASTSATNTGITGLTFKCSALSGTSPTITFACTTSFVSPSGTIPIVLTVDGISFTKMFTYAIAFKGSTGSAGAASSSYWLISSADTVQKTTSGDIICNPATVSFTSKTQIGSGKPINYACRWIVAYTTDGTAYTDIYTSTADEVNVVVNADITYKALRARMYLAGGTETLLDEQIIPFVSDGAVGAPGGDAVTFQVYSNNGYALSLNTPTITLQTFAYSGDTEITAGATYQWYSYNDGVWSAISGETLGYLDVSRDDVSFSNSYMCKMTFNGVEYTGVATVDDKNDSNAFFSSKPTSYTAGDFWFTAADYSPPGHSVGTLLRAEHTNSTYSDDDWVVGSKYDAEILDLKKDIDAYNQHFSFDSVNGVKISARGDDGSLSEFSTTLTNERLSFNYGNNAVAYIDATKMNIKEAEIESPLTITGKYSGSTMEQAPIINIGNFSIVVESNGSLSIVANT